MIYWEHCGYRGRQKVLGDTTVFLDSNCYITIFLPNIKEAL